MKRLFWAAGLFVAILLPGCRNSSDVGVLLDGAVDSAAAVPAPITDANYTNGYLTPSDVRIAFFKAGLSTATATAPSFTIFDLGSPAAATAASLDGSGTTIGSSPNLPAAGTYTTLSVGMTYIAFVVTANTSDRERFRVYLSSVSSGPGLPGAVAARDVLIENPVDSGSYQWIDTTTALPASTRPANPLKMPSAQLPSGSGDPFIANITLSSPLTLSPGDKGLFTLSLVAAVHNLFFYDDVNTNGLFDYPPLSCADPRDGCLSALATPIPPADFAPAYAGFTASAAAPTPTPTP